MSLSAETKLQELRGKTNRQLVSLISNKLDSGLAFARAAEDENDVANAEKALCEAKSWMTLLHDPSELDERRLKFKLSQLGNILDRARASEVPMHAAC